jgi:hypothetical protein
MNAEDHLAELRSQIHAMAAKPDVRQFHLGYRASSAPSVQLLARAEKARTKSHLQSLHARREGLWIDARAPGNPYQQTELRRLVHEEFEALLPFALQASDTQPTSDELGDALGSMAAQITEFTVAFGPAKSRFTKS